MNIGWVRAISSLKSETSPNFKEFLALVPLTQAQEGSSVYVVFKTTSNNGAKITDKPLALSNVLSFWTTCNRSIRGQAQ
jgi:hypothetical protein